MRINRLGAVRCAPIMTVSLSHWELRLSERNRSMTRRLGLVVLLVVCAAVPCAAEEAPPADAKPKAILQLEAGGPTAAVPALLFSKDVKTLYAPCPHQLVP